MRSTIGYLIAGVIGGATVLFTYTQLMDHQEVGTVPSSIPVQFTNMPTAPAGIAPTVDLTYAASNTVNAVVHVTTEASVEMTNPIDMFWGRRSAPRTQRGAGSGVIVSADGYIVTNNHVVQGADVIKVHLNDERSYVANVVGLDPSTDLAVLKIKEHGLPSIEMGNSDEVKIGEWVLAVGNPLNLTSTVTAGIVSAKARNINLLQHDPSRDIFPVESFIQTDAAVNPGNSGGALVNTDGKLIGINTAIASMTGSYAGYSFAVPVNLVKKVTKDLMEYGTVQRAYIGVSIRNMDQEMAEKVGLASIKGVFVNGLTDGGAASEAGIKAGDVILKVGQRMVNNVPQLQEQVSNFRPGDKVNLTVYRGGNERSIDLRLKDVNGKTQLSEKNVAERPALVLGAELASVRAEDLRALNLTNGVQVKNINNGRFRSSGIREGFIIYRVDGADISKPEDVENAIGKKNGGVLVEGVYPNGMKAYYGLGI